jgi:hypothetical protein
VLRQVKCLSVDSQFVKLERMEDNASEYAIFDVQRLEVHDKAQVLVYAYLTQQKVATKEELERALTEIYQQYQDTVGFRRFKRPTVVSVSLFMSEELGKQNKAAWIGSLTKGPKDAEPILTIDVQKLEDLRAWEANEWTESTIAYEKLNRSLFHRGLELCSFNKRLGEIERECKRKADVRYPDFSVEHTPYVDELLAAATNEIKVVHHLDDELLHSVHVFARVHCR